MRIFFSLIIGTLNRPKILKVCLSNLCIQSLKDFEVLIIDQSDNNESKKVVDGFRDRLNINYIHENTRGLSRARNIGIEIMKGTHYCLIDDDAIYAPNYLEIAKKYLQNNDNKCILSGTIFDIIKNECLVPYNRIRNNNFLSQREILRFCPSAALIIPKEDKFFLFDELFGVGAQFGAGEESDLLLRYAYNGYTVKHIDTLQVQHPIIVDDCFPKFDINKVEKYSIGIGALYKKHIIGYKNIKLFISFGEEILKRIVRLIIKKEKKTQCILYKGFIFGFFKYNVKDIDNLEN